MTGLNGPLFVTEEDELVEEKVWPPERAEMIFEATILGEQVPAGSKNGFAVRHKDDEGIWRLNIKRDEKGNESAIVTVSDVNASRLKKQRERVNDQIIDAIFTEGFQRVGSDVPIAVEAFFYRGKRAENQYGSGRNAGIMKAWAWLFPTKKPDLTKLWRGLEDHLSELLWHDDSRVCDSRLAKRFGPERVEIVLYKMPQTVGEIQGEEENEQVSLL